MRPGPIVLPLLVATSLVAGGGMDALLAQQVVDTAWMPTVRLPRHAAGSGPRVGLDAGHHNGMTPGEGLQPLARLLAADGYRVRALHGSLDAEVLRELDLLVVVDALAPENVDRWVLPTPSALAPAEVAAVEAWVRQGGALLLVADHMPFAGAVAALAGRFGVRSSNGFALDTATWDPITFRRADGSLAAHPVTDGWGPGERVDSVFTWFGHAFTASPALAAPLLVLPPGTVSLEPREAWRFERDTGVHPVGGWFHATALEPGSGRFVMLGDSGLLGAHLVGPNRRPVGLNAPRAGQNAQFLRNIAHWLTAPRRQAEP